ncbi:MAG: hypothetical protein E7665_08535 [Ruminococcaceae bacterium]|nr:hypothetical protein [Oscillospiraceae bacterium]
MSYVIKNKKLFAVIMLVVMMSSVLVLPASALLNYGMGGVSFTDANGVQYAEGYIWNLELQDGWEYAGRLECDYDAFLIVELSTVGESLIDGRYVPFNADDVQLSSTWANAEMFIPDTYFIYDVQADFYVDDVHKGYSHIWNEG